MQTEYTHSKKVKLANKIGKIKKEKDYRTIFKIISEDTNAGKHVQDSSGVHMFFHKLSDETYSKIEDELNNIRKRYSALDSTSSDNYSDKQDYKPYVEEEFPTQTNICPKLKYSNRERSLIKRRRYNDTINSDHDSSDVIYTSFDVNASESETRDVEKDKDKDKDKDKVKVKVDRHKSDSNVKVL